MTGWAATRVGVAARQRSSCPLATGGSGTASLHRRDAGVARRSRRAKGSSSLGRRVSTGMEVRGPAWSFARDVRAQLRWICCCLRHGDKDEGARAPAGLRRGWLVVAAGQLDPGPRWDWLAGNDCARGLGRWIGMDPEVKEDWRRRLGGWDKGPSVLGFCPKSTRSIYIKRKRKTFRG